MDRVAFDIKTGAILKDACTEFVKPADVFISQIDSDVEIGGCGDYIISVLTGQKPSKGYRDKAADLWPGIVLKIKPYNQLGIRYYWLEPFDGEYGLLLSVRGPAQSHPACIVSEFLMKRGVVSQSQVASWVALIRAKAIPPYFMALDDSKPLTHIF